MKLPAALLALLTAQGFAAQGCTGSSSSEKSAESSAGDETVPLQTDQASAAAKASSVAPQPTTPPEIITPAPSATASGQALDRPPASAKPKHKIEPTPPATPQHERWLDRCPGCGMG